MQPMAAQASSNDAQPDSIVALSDVRFSWQRDGEPVIDIAALRIAHGERVFLRGPAAAASLRC